LKSLGIQPPPPPSGPDGFPTLLEDTARYFNHMGLHACKPSFKTRQTHSTRPSGYRNIELRSTFNPHSWTTSWGTDTRDPYSQGLSSMTPRTKDAHTKMINLLRSGGVNPSAKLDHFSEHTAEPMRDIKTIGLRDSSNLGRTQFGLASLVQGLKPQAMISSRGSKNKGNIALYSPKDK